MSVTIERKYIRKTTIEWVNFLQSDLLKTGRPYASAELVAVLINSNHPARNGLNSNGAYIPLLLLEKNGIWERNDTGGRTKWTRISTDTVEFISSRKERTQNPTDAVSLESLNRKMDALLKSLGIEVAA